MWARLRLSPFDRYILKFSNINLYSLYGYNLLTTDIFTESHVVRFLFRILFGENFKHICNIYHDQSKSKINKASEDDIIKACLSTACGPTFRHTTINIAQNNKNTINYEKLFEKSNNICDIFVKYCNCPTTQEKTFFLLESDANIKVFFKGTKELNGQKGLCFGHFQKLFNLALKLYACVYTFQKALHISVTWTKIDAQAIINADCPIDSKIINTLIENHNCKQFSGVKWSKMKSPRDILIYQQMQSVIRSTGIGSNLLFDFEEWF